MYANKMSILFKSPVNKIHRFYQYSTINYFISINHFVFIGPEDDISGSRSNF